MKRIIIDAGHGGKDSGTVWFKTLEKDIALQLALKTETHLKIMYEVEVRQTRRSDVYLSLTERSDFANKTGCDLFFSIHLNSSINRLGHGYEDYIHDKLKDDSNTAKIREAFHEMIQDNALAKYKIKNRGKKKENFHVLRETAMPAILAETLFLDNTIDNKILKDPHFIDDMAWSYAKGLGHALQLPEKPAPKKGAPWYRVQVGAFKEKDNAMKLVDELRSKGYPAYINSD